MPKHTYLKPWSRHYTVQYCEVALRCYGSESKPHTPAPIDDAFFLPEQGNESFYASTREWNILNKKLQAVLHKAAPTRTIINGLHKYGKLYAAFGKKYSAQKLTKLSNFQVAKVYRDYTQLSITYCAYLALIHILNNLATDEANKLLTTRGLKAAAAYNTLLSPLKKTGILKLQDELLKLRDHDQQFSQAQMTKLLKKYSWISCLDLQNQPWRKKDLLNFYKNLAPEPRETINFKKACQLAKLSGREIRFFQLVRELVYLKDMRDVYRRKGVYNILPLFEDMGRRLQIGRKTLVYFTSQEILNTLTSGSRLNRTIAKKRQEGFALYNKQGRIIASVNQADLNKLKKRVSAEALTTKDLAGISASSGKEKGLVKIILNVRDISKIKKGNVLVAVTTHPDFVPAMQKAAAIITDEGGITSHAAIVARELEIPCIVGTKFATKIFKDGDLVEVDANKGIVRKLR